MNCRKVGMLTKSKCDSLPPLREGALISTFIFSLHFMKVKALSHILSLQILIFLTGTLFFEDPIHHFNLIVFAGSAGPPASLKYCATFCSWRKTVSAFVSSPLTSQLLHLSTLRSDRCISGAVHQLHQPPADLLCLLCANKATSGTYCHVK